jgi:hypothetical protein
VVVFYVNSLVDISPKAWAERPWNWGSIPIRAGDSSFLRNVQKSTGAHPGFYVMVTWVTQQGHEADHSSASSAEVKIDGAVYLHSPIRLPSVVLNHFIAGKSLLPPPERTGL